jgi:hypothetical protein
MFSEGNAALPCDSPLQIVMAVCRTFFLIWPCWTCWVGCCSPLLTIMAVCNASNFKRSVLNSHYYLQQAVTPDQITQQNSLQRALKAGKALFQANTRPRIFFIKSNCHHKYRKEVVRKFSLWQFWVHDAWTLWGQESPLMNKKGSLNDFCSNSTSTSKLTTIILCTKLLYCLVQPPSTYWSSARKSKGAWCKETTYF